MRRALGVGVSRISPPDSLSCCLLCVYMYVVVHVFYGEMRHALYSTKALGV